MSRIIIAVLATLLFEFSALPQLATDAEEGPHGGSEATRDVYAIEQEVATRGNIYSARQVLSQEAGRSNDPAILERYARVEDWYGSAAPQAYKRLLTSRVNESAPKSELVQISSRALQVSLREEQFDAARYFATRLAELGDQSGLALLTSHTQAEPASSVPIPGGMQALEFLLSGKRKSSKRSLVDYSRMLTSAAIDGNVSDSRNAAQNVDEYFAHITALVSLGNEVNGHTEIHLTVRDKAGEQHTEAALQELGFKLNRSDTGIDIEWAEAKSQAGRQNIQAALGVDEQAIQETLAAGRTYILNIPVDYVPIYPAEPVWRSAFPRYEHDAGGFAQLLADDPNIAQVYFGLNSMDRAAADALLSSVSLRDLARQCSRSLALFSPAFALNEGDAEVPGGPAATAAWQALMDESPTQPGSFYRSLLFRDDGYLVAFFHDLSQLNFPRQQFFTRSPARLKRFYALFREAAEMRRGHTGHLARSTFFDFLCDVPLNDSGAVNYPGSRAVWMVATGDTKSVPSVGELTATLRGAEQTEGDDELLTRLAKAYYSVGAERRSELANFDAVVRVNNQRKEPLSPEAALLLAESYTRYGALYPYFAELGDLTVADYRDLLDLVEKLNHLDNTSANIRLGELHSYIAILCLLDRTGNTGGEQVLRLYRTAIKRYADCERASEWVSASLTSLAELAQLAPKGEVGGYDAAIRTLLIGALPDTAGSKPESITVSYNLHQHQAYEGVLRAQRVPSLASFFRIRDCLQHLSKDSSALEEIEKQISLLTTVPVPYRWSISLRAQKWLERCQTSDLTKTLAKLGRNMREDDHERVQSENLPDKLLGQLEPWLSLAMSGQIYARYFDPSDLLVSSDPLLLRKHEFSSGDWDSFWRGACPRAEFIAFSSGEGSLFLGGFAEFSSAVGLALARGNHLGGPLDRAFTGALLASVRATDWRTLTESDLQTFGANVRLAREWIVESSTSAPMRQEVQRELIGLVSPVRRSAFATAITARDWQSVWKSLSVGDEFFLGRSLAQKAPDSLWTNNAAVAMKRLATKAKVPDVLGQVAPDLSGSGAPRLHEYEPYEAYERYYMPQFLGERSAELKFYLAWQADCSGWQASALPVAAVRATNAVATSIDVRDSRDWRSAVDAYRTLHFENIQPVVEEQ